MSLRAEVFLLSVTGGEIRLIEGAARTIDVAPGSDPTQTVRDALTDDIAVLHSTSWRYEDGAVLLTFVAIVEQGRCGRPSVVVRRAPIATGEATQPPAEVHESQVLTHALRHLAWLAEEDVQCRLALPAGWVEQLGKYAPQPFRHLGAGERP